MARSVEVAKAWITLEANTKGLEQGLTQAEKSLGRVSKFVKDHPMAALGALGTAALGAGLKLAQMAEETNKAIGIIADRVPGATGKIDELRHVVNRLAVEYAVSQDQIIETMDAASRAGVRSAEELVAVTRAATAAGRALGVEGVGLVEGLDAALDIFGIAAKDSTALMVQFFAAAQGRTSVEDLLDTITRLAPAIQGTGLDVVTTTNALATLLDQGFKAGKPLIAQFKEELERGIPRIKELADEAAGDQGAEGAVDRFTAALKRNVDTIEGDQARAQATLKGQLTELGDAIEPVAKGAVSALAFIVKFVRGIDIGTAVGQSMLAAAAERAAKGADLSAGAFERLGVSGGVAAGKTAALAATLVEAKNATKDIGSVSVADMKRYEAALKESAKAGKLDGDSQKALSKIVDELSDRRKKGAKAATDAARDAGEARKILFELEKTVTDATITLAGAQRQQVEALEIQFGQEMQKLRGADLDRAKAILDQAKTQLGDKWKKIYDFIGETIEPKLKKTEESTGKLVTQTSDLTAALLPLNIAYGNLSVAHDDAIENQQKHREEIAKTARAVADGADVFLALATAIGASSPELESVVNGVADVADAIGRIASGDLAGGLLQGISGLSGVISGLFGGESESARKLRVSLELTRDKIEQHRQKLGDLIEVTLPGRQVKDIQSVLSAFLAGPASSGLGTGGKIGVASEGRLAGALFGKGISLGDVEDLAKSFGIDLRPNGRLNRQMLDAFVDFLASLDAGFEESFKGQRDRNQRRQQITGAGPEEKLADLIDILTGAFGSPAIAGALKGLDLGTSGGRNSAIAKLLELLENPDADLGGLNLQQFRDVLSELADLIKEVGSLDPAAIGTDPERPPIDVDLDPSEPIPVEDPIFTPNLEALNWESLLGLQVEERDLLQGILDRMPAPGGVAAPALPAVAMAGFGSAGISAPITINVGDIIVQGTGNSAEDGRAIRDALVDELMASRLENALLGQGINTRFFR